MKEILKISLVIIFTTLFFASCSSDDDSDDSMIIEYSSLPTAAKKIKETHFSEYTTTSVTQRYTADSDGTFYSLYLTNGYELDFDRNGDWVSMEATLYSFPSSLFGTEIPENIKTYTNSEYPNQRIKEVDKIVSGYKVELNNDVNLRFDTSGTFISVN